MKTETFYRKVVIESEADLPKEAGGYFAKHVRLGENYYPFRPELVKLADYVNDFNWYLQPESEVEVKTADEIINILKSWLQSKDEILVCPKCESKSLKYY